MSFLICFFYCHFLILVISVEFEQSGYMVNERAGYIEICLLSSGQNNADIIVMVRPQETVPVSARGMYVLSLVNFVCVAVVYIC